MPIPPEAFILTPGFAGTLQKQIRRLVSEGVVSGRFRASDKLPSSRKLAAHLGVSRITVTLAYAELLSDGYLLARGRSGYFIAPDPPRRAQFEPTAGRSEHPVDWSRALGQRVAGRIAMDKPAAWRTYPYRFIYGQADDSLFDHRNWRLCALQALGRREFPAVSGDQFDRDDPELIEHIALHTLPRRGILVRPEQILITLGAQNALWLAAEILLGQRRVAAMENPGYLGLRAILEQTRCRLVSVAVDEDGLPFSAAPDGVDVVFATPSHHCPTNATMSVERRRGLLADAARRGYLIVEDDYEFEMSFARSPAPALKSFDRDGRVIYVGSFSKSLLPGLRLGYLVGDEAFIREARALRATVLRHPPGMVQRTVAHFLALGHYDALISRMSGAFKARRALMAEAIAGAGLTTALPGVSGGSSFWMRAPDPCDTEALAERLGARGVLIEPGRGFFDPAAAPRNYYRLAYSSIEPGKIAEGIRLIADEMRQSGFI